MERRRLAKKFFLLAGVVSVLVLCVYLAWFYHAQSIENDRRALAEARVLSAEIGAAWDYIDAVQPQINRATGETSGIYCAVAAKDIAKRFSAGSAYSIRYIRGNPRNAEDAPDDFERKALAAFEPEEMLRAMKEYYEANPVTETTICAGMVGVPMLDPEIDTMLYLTDACTELELFQDGNHQKMGLTCTDCHMPQTEAADGATYTHHSMTQSPLENPAALEKCLTCHKSQGVEDADAMVTFVKGKMDELAQIQQATKTKLDEFHAKLAEVVAAGNADETKLQAAKDAYNLANVYFLYQGTAMRPTDGSMAAMNFSKSVEQLQKADDAIAEGMAQIA